MNPVDYFDAGCRLAPTRDCLVNGVTGEHLSYLDVQQMTKRIAAGLRRDLEIGRRAAILGPNDATGFAITLGCYRAGIVAVPLNHRNHVVENIAVMTSRSAELLFIHSSLAASVEAFRAALPGMRHFVLFGDAVDCAAAVPLERWWGEAADGEIDLPDNPQRVYCIQSTSGTTGIPKGVLWPVRELEFTVASFLHLTPFKGKPVMLAVAPLTHAAGKCVHHLLISAAVIVVLPIANPKAILDAIEYWKITHLFLPPTIIYRLLDEPDVRRRDFSSLAYIIYGAAPMSAERLRESLEVFGPVMAQAYGQTESGVPICCMGPADHFIDGTPAAERLKSVGRAGPLSRVEILGEDGQILAIGAVGEIAVRSAGIMISYDGDEAATAATRSGPWHLTGDIGWRDKDGFFYIVDRKRDIIISGGFNVYSAEVERVLNAHPGVNDCAVIGVPHDDWGEAVKAIVELKTGVDVAAGELITFCRTSLSSVKTPKSVDFVKQLPRSPVGKVLKRELREQFWAGRGRTI
jgi:acyl-CoA synthetase (AMP-forming)/AMP-acid ligase II